MNKKKKKRRAASSVLPTHYIKILHRFSYFVRGMKGDGFHSSGS